MGTGNGGLPQGETRGASWLVGKHSESPGAGRRGSSGAFLHSARLSPRLVEDTKEAAPSLPLLPLPPAALPPGLCLR